MLIIGEKNRNLYIFLKMKEERKEGEKLSKCLACIAFLKIFTCKRFNICKHIVL